MKTYGAVNFNAVKKEWCITAAQPHVCIKLKAIFERIKKADPPPYTFPDSMETAGDLRWFIERYPLKISTKDKNYLNKRQGDFVAYTNMIEKILMPNYKPKASGGVVLKVPFVARPYQLSANDAFDKLKHMLCGDDIGLGKTLTSILAMKSERLPALVCCQTHLPKQWEDEIRKFTNLTTHQIKGTKPYTLPVADVYIITYSRLSGWVDVISNGFFKYAVFDECQELRVSGSNKYIAAKRVCLGAEYVMFLSATPVMNYGDEMWTILNCMKENCMGYFSDFQREWCGWHREVADAKALGTYLRERFLIIRRTREEVGQQLPEINKIIYEIDYDEDEAKSHEEIMKQLAMRVVSNDYRDSFSASGEFDLKMRQLTGIAKAKYAAAYIKMILDCGHQVLVGAWHREVYSILLKELAAYNPVMYTGSESPKQKYDSKEAFTSGVARVMLMSNRSGAGLDGLQLSCSWAVIVELDWSPGVTDQFIGRLDRPGQEERVTAVYLTTNYGSDPSLIDLLAVKSTQALGIVDPTIELEEKYSDDSRIKEMAKRFLASV